MIQEKPVDRVIDGLAAQVNAAQWGVGFPSSAFPTSVDAGPPLNSPAVGGVRYHVAQYVGGVAYSDAPNALRLIRALSVHGSPQDLSEVNPSLFFGLRAELPHDTGRHTADAHEIRLRPLHERTLGNGPLSEISCHCLNSRKPSRAFKHLDSPWFHCRRWELSAEVFACQKKGFAKS